MVDVLGTYQQGRLKRITENPEIEEEEMACHLGSSEEEELETIKH